MKLFLLASVILISLFGATVIAFALDYTADLSLSLSEQYNDNIYLAHTDRVSDYVTVISPVLALSTQTQKINAMLSYSPSWNYYSSHSDKTAFNQQAGAQGLFSLTERLSFGLSDTFVQSKETSNISNLTALQGAGPLVAGQNTLTTNTVSGNLSYRLSEQITLQPSLSYTTTNNSEQSVGDINTFTGGMGISYLLTDRTSLRVNASYTNYDYSVGSNSNGQEYIVGINHRFTPTLTVDAFGGVDVTKIDSPSTTDTGFTGGITITKTFEKGSASISFKDSVVPGLQGNSPLKSQVVIVNYARPLTAYLDSSLSAWYGQYKSVGNVGADQKRNEISGTASLSYRLLQWANLFLSYTYVNSDDRINNSNSYHNQIVAAGIKLSKQAKF